MENVDIDVHNGRLARAVELTKISEHDMQCVRDDYETRQQSQSIGGERSSDSHTP